MYVLTDKTNVYSFNALSYHTYVIGNELVVVPNSCCDEKGVYELKYNDGKTYIGKGSRARMNQSARKWAENGKRVLLNKQFTPCTSDKAAFIMEHIKMMESGFGHEGCTLLNSIFSPGLKILLTIF